MSRIGVKKLLFACFLWANIFARDIYHDNAECLYVALYLFCTVFVHWRSSTTVLRLLMLLLSCAIAYCVDVILIDEFALFDWKAFVLLVTVTGHDTRIVFACFKQLTYRLCVIFIILLVMLYFITMLWFDRVYFSACTY